MVDLSEQFEAGPLKRVDRVMHAIRQRIDNRVLTPGARVMSVRGMAEAMRVSRSTVVEAYDRLVAEGVLRSRPGAGFFVAAPLAPLTLAQMEPAIERDIDPLWMMRESLAASSDALQPGCGWLPDDWMPLDAIRKALRTIARNGDAGTLLKYGTRAGSLPLRTVIARRMADQQIDASPDHVLLTDSGTNAIDLVCRFLLQPGDTVLLDDPCYFNFHAMLRAHRVTIVSVPYTPTGPDLVAFADALVAHRPRLYITNSAAHNPTGASLSANTAHRLLKLAEAHDLIVLEDDIFADFEDEPSPRLAAFDGLERVIRVGSFSKTCSASIRCGHIAARPDWIAALADLKLATGVASDPLSASIMVSVLTDGSYRHHVESLRTRLAAARERIIRRLPALGLTLWVKPLSGMFLWCQLPDGASATQVARHALADRIVLAPGNVFSHNHSAARFLRLNVAQMTDERAFSGLRQAIERATNPDIS